MSMMVSVFLFLCIDMSLYDESNRCVVYVLLQLGSSSIVCIDHYGLCVFYNPTCLIPADVWG